MAERNVANTAVAIAMTLIMILAVGIPAVNETAQDREVIRTYTITNSGQPFAFTGEDTDSAPHILTMGLNGDTFIVICDGQIVDTGIGPYQAPSEEDVVYPFALGVYEAYEDDGVLVSQSGRSPTANLTLTRYATSAQAGNQDNSNGVYQLWNYQEWTLYRMMCFTIMGNMDSQYMMGDGPVNNSTFSETGQATSAYTKALDDTSSVSMLLENPWGSLREWLGDATINGTSLVSGNSMGGVTSADKVVNVLEEEVACATGRTMWATFNPVSDAFGAFASGKSTLSLPGEGINDRFGGATGSSRGITVGGDWSTTSNSGLSYVFSGQQWNSININIGARLAYHLTYSGVPEGKDYAYIMSYNVNGTIQDVKSYVGGEMVSYMPEGTTLNEYWNFDENGIGPFGCYYVAINIADGINTDDLSEQRLSHKKGEIAYILDPDDFTRTLAGTQFSPALYNVMLVVPPVYWYSELDEGSTTTGKLYMASSPDAFAGKTLKAYAHVDGTRNIQYTPESSASYADLAIGDDALLQLYSSSDAVIQTSAGTVNLGQVTSSISVIIQNGELIYTDSTETQGTVNVNLYTSNDGTFVRTLADANVLNGTTISVNQFGYPNLTSEDTVAVGLIGVGTPAEITQNIQPYNAPDVDTVTVTADSVSDEYYTTIHHMEASVDLVDTEHVSVPVAMYVHASEDYERTDIIPGGGMLYEVTSFIPLLLIFALLMCLIVPLIYVRIRD